MTVEFFGIPFTVELAETRLTTLNMGESVFDQCQIIIQGDLPPDRQEQVFIHEAVHVLLDGEEDKEDINEGFVRRLGNSLYDFLHDNDLLKEGWFDRLLDRPDADKVVPITRARGKADQ